MKGQDNYRRGIAAPLLESSSHRTASTVQTLGNIIVSVVGTGILGLPFAFRIAGWLAGSLGVVIVGFFTCYCMLLLVQCRETDMSEPTTYGNLGYKSMGKTGRYLAEFLIFITQCGGAVAYLVFLAQNLVSVFEGHSFTFTPYVMLIIVPIEIGLSWINTLSALAPFSIFADICNLLAMLIVLKEDISQLMVGGFPFKERKAMTSNIDELYFAAGIAVFCFGGFGVTLALQNSMRKKSAFSRLLGQALAGIIALYVLFGFFGYMAYGDQTRDIVILNLPRNWSSQAVQIGICLGTMFTFPIMVYPIHEIIEGKVKVGKWFKKLGQKSNGDSATKVEKIGIYISRAILIVVLAFLATCFPEFGVFASHVGSTLCALIAFVLPPIFHLIIFGFSPSTWQGAMDIVVLSSGLFLAGFGAYKSIVGV